MEIVAWLFLITVTLWLVIYTVSFIQHLGWQFTVGAFMYLTLVVSALGTPWAIWYLVTH